MEPRGRAINWLCDEDMLPKTVPEGRIWVYNYNANCYSDKAQEVGILGLGESFLETLWIAKDKDVGKRPLAFIGSCFGGILVAQVSLAASVVSISCPTFYSFANKGYTDRHWREPTEME